MTEDELALREQIEQRQRELGGLEQSLQAANSELEALSAQKNQYELLEEICGALLKLDDLGVERLFWGEQYDSGDTTEHILKVRRRIESFNGKLAEIEKRRQAIAGKMYGQNESIDYLDDDLLDLLEKEETHKAEWLIETEERAIPYRASVMPWTRGGEEDQRLRKSLALSMLVCILLALLADLVQLPVPEFAELSEVPERVAQLIERKREVPPPQPVVEELAVEEEPIEVDPEEPLVAEEQQPEEIIPEPAPSEEELRQAAREQVASKGILAFRDSFSSRAQSAPSTQLGADARIGNAGEAAVGRPERAMVTTQGPGSSGGINLSSISRNVGGGGGDQIAGVELSRVASSIGGGGGGGSNRRMSGRPLAGRTDEEIQIVFDRYKAALYRLYNRELRKDPTLRGQLVLRLTIEPDGSVSLCELQSSDMDAPALAQQIVTRVRGFDFGAKKDIVAMTIIYPIDFLPAA